MGPASHTPQGTLDLVELLGLAQKLQRDVKRLRPYPANIRRELTHLIAEFGDSLSYAGIDVECYKETHRST